MPQGATHADARPTHWLKEFIRTKSVGSEFVLPWAVDTFFRAINEIKTQFTPNELKTVIEAYQDIRLLPGDARGANLAPQFADACDRRSVHLNHGVNRYLLEGKLRLLDETQATAMMVWAAAFWTGSSRPLDALSAYVRIG